MKLPGVERARIDAGNVRNYLLARNHLEGGPKARFFESLGYRRKEWRVLESDLIAHAVDGDAFAGRPSRHGRLFIVRGTLVTPSGRRVGLRAIWIVLTGEDFPRLVTAYPE